MNKTIRENLHLSFKTNGPDMDDIDDLSNIDLDEIVNVVKDYMQSKSLQNDTDLDDTDLDDTDLDDTDLDDTDLDDTDLDDTDLDDTDLDDTDLDDTSEFDSLDYDDDTFELGDTSEFDELDSEPEFELDGEVDLDDSADENDFQGDIRTVKGAKLVFKRKTEDGTFEELWIYNVGKDMKAETQIRRAILAGTDINPSTNQSDDGEQNADVATVGNVQFLHIIGLHN